MWVRHFEQNGIEDSKTVSKSIKDIAIPDGYFLWYFRYNVSILWRYTPQFKLQIGGDSFDIVKDETSPEKALIASGGSPHIDPLDNARNVLPVSIVGYDINAYTVSVEA